MIAKEAFQSKSPTKRLHGWFHEVAFSMDITSLRRRMRNQSQSSAVRFSEKVKAPRQRKEEAVFSPDGNRLIIFRKL